MIKSSLGLFTLLLVLISCGGSGGNPAENDQSSKSPDGNSVSTTVNPFLFIDICEATACSQSRVVEFDLGLGLAAASMFSLPQSDQYYRTRLDGNAIAHLGNKLFFSAQVDMSGSYQVFEYDFEVNSLKSINSLGEDPRNFVIHDEKLFYAASTAAFGEELWSYDPQSEVSEMFLDINSGSADSEPKNFISVGDKLYFTAIDSTHGEELRELDTSEVLGVSNPAVADIFVGSNSGIPSRIRKLGSQIYFSAFETTNGVETWILDTNIPIDMSTSSVNPNPSLMADLEPGLQSTFPDNYAMLNGKIYFTATTASTGDEIWEYDPITKALPTAIEVISGSQSSSITSMLVVNEKLFFNANDAMGDGEELWSYNPSLAQSSTNPSLLFDIASGSDSSSPDLLGNYQNLLYFVATDSVHGRELRVLDTESSNPPVVIDYTVGSESSEIRDFYLIDGQ